MAFDLTAHLGSMTRVVRKMERDGKPAEAVIATRVFDTDAADLWDALTNAERLPRWFLPVSGDLRLGGRYQFEGNAGGTISACEPHQSLAVTWEFGGEVSWVTLRLEPEGSGTRLTLEHVAHVANELWSKFGPGGVGVGWDLGLMGLARYLADPAQALRPPEADEAWLISPEAKSLYRTTSEAWCRAWIAAGAPEKQALAAAERTRAFYAGETTHEV
jgi:uncharacterized protein YndB with AHSA1/START domain